MSERDEALDAIHARMRGVRPNDVPRKETVVADHERKGVKGRTPPVIAYVRNLGNYLVTSEVAELLDVSPGWVRKAARERWTQAPSWVAPYGRNHVYLFTPDDVEALRSYLDHPSVVPTDEFMEG